MKNSIILRFIIGFCFIIITGCSVEGSLDNGAKICWTIIDDNTGSPISTANLQVNFFLGGGSQSKIIECDNRGNGCLSFEDRLPKILSCTARAPGYSSKYFIENIPGVIKLNKE